MTSLRQRLLWGTGLATAALLVAFGFLFDAQLERTLTADLDQRLRADADSLAADIHVRFPTAVQRQATALGLAADPELATGTEEERSEARRKLLALAAARLALVRSASSPEDPARPWTLRDAGGQAIAGEGEFAWPADPMPTQHDRHRIHRHDLTPVPFESPGWRTSWDRIRGEALPDAQRATLYVARSTAALEETMQRFRTLLLVGGLVLLTLLLAAAWFVVRGALAPLRRMEAQVEALEARRLDTRLPTDAAPRELRPFVDKLNDALGRLERSFGRERRVAASLAHELRTPLAELRSATDQVRRWPDDEEVQREHVTLTDEATAHMERVVSAMLRLARIQSGQEQAENNPVDLGACVARVVDLLADLARTGEHDVRWTPSIAHQVESDEEMLEVLFRSLLQNALEHAPKGSPVDITCTAGPEEISVRFVNDAPALSADDLAYLTEPFWRGSSSREGDTGGGLGGSIADALARSLGGRLAYRLEAGRLHATLVLPTT